MHATTTYVTMCYVPGQYGFDPRLTLDVRVSRHKGSLYPFCNGLPPALRAILGSSGSEEKMGASSSSEATGESAAEATQAEATQAARSAGETPAAPQPTEASALLKPESSSQTSEAVAMAKERFQAGMSLAALVSIAVIKTQITAFLFRSNNYPTAYSMWSCVVTDALLVPCFLISPKNWAVPKPEMTGVLSLIVVFTAFDLGFTNIALAQISTALQQCIAATNPFWCILLETIVYGKWQHPVVYATVTLLVVGATLASLGSVDHITAFGVTAACLAVLSSASKAVFTHKTFRAFKGDMGTLALLFWVDLFMIPIYLVWTLANGELVDMWRVVLADASVFWQFTGTAALGGVRALTQMAVLYFVSATSMSISNQSAQALNILISLPIQHTPITPALVTGFCLVIAFSSFYALCKITTSVLTWFDDKCRALGLPCVREPPPKDVPPKAGE